MILAATAATSTIVRTAAARRNKASRQPRGANVATIAKVKASAPSCVKASTSITSKTSAVPAAVGLAKWLTANAGQNKACASHISVGKPNTSGQSRAVEAQA